MSKFCIAIVGPTAVGKTDLALHLAKYFSTSIISADSRQCYKELNIGVAKPSPHELAEVFHFFINSHHIVDSVSAADFEKSALAYAADVFNTKDVVILAGGTGLYVKSFLEGMDDMPEVDHLLREQILHDYKKNGLGWLQQCLLNEDPLFAQQGEMKNPQRCMRALEVVRQTGTSILNRFTGSKKQRPFTSIKIGLELPRWELYRRIDERVEVMMKNGLAKEVAGLKEYKNLNALQTVGYREMFEHFNGSISLNRTIELIKQNTHRYAKRQLTWFKRDPEINWFTPDDKKILEFLMKQINN